MIARHHALRDVLEVDPLGVLGGWERVSLVAERHRAEVRFRPLVLGVPEIVLGRTVYVDSGLSRPWRLWYIAHGLGHVILHAGDQRFLSVACYGVVDRQEAQAERYAAFLLAPALTSYEDLADVPSELWDFRANLEVVCGERAA